MLINPFKNGNTYFHHSFCKYRVDKRDEVLRKSVFSWRWTRNFLPLGITGLQSTLKLIWKKLGRRARNVAQLGDERCKRTVQLWSNALADRSTLLKRALRKYGPRVWILLIWYEIRTNWSPVKMVKKLQVPYEEGDLSTRRNRIRFSTTQIQAISGLHRSASRQSQRQVFVNTEWTLRFHLSGKEFLE